MHQEGEQLVAAGRQCTRADLDEASEAALALLGPAAIDPDAVTGLLDDDPPLDDSEEAQAEWDQTPAEDVSRIPGVFRAGAAVRTIFRQEICSSYDFAPPIPGTSAGLARPGVHRYACTRTMLGSWR